MGFTCTTFGVTMPADRQQEFCARRYRKALAGDFCGQCKIGNQAARDDRAQVQAAVAGAGKSGPPQTPKAITKESKEDIMAGTKKCSCGCGKLAVKDGLSSKCYRKKHGHAPYSKTPTKKSVDDAPVDRSACQSCREHRNVEQILVNAGRVSQEIIDKAHKLAKLQVEIGF